MASELPTPQELAAIAQQALRSKLDPNGTGAVDLNPGSRNDIMISVNAALAFRVAQYVADRVTARSISTATGDDLSVVVTDIYQDLAKPANAATGVVYFYRTGTVETVIPTGTRVAVPASGTQPGLYFSVTQDVPVADGEGLAGSPISVPVTCTQTGVIGNVLLTAITKIVDPLEDTTWKIATPPTGAKPIAGGAEAETDDQFRSRIQQSAFDDSKKRGTKKAIQTGALQVPGVQYVTAVEPFDGTVLLFAGDANYNLSDALATAILANLETWRAFGMPCFVNPYDVNTITLSINIYMSRPLHNYNIPTLQTQAVTNISNYFKNRPRPDEVFGSAIIAAAAATHVETQSVSIASMDSSGSTQPDSSNNIKRAADTDYGSVTEMPVYVVSNASIQINIFPPLTQ